MVLEGYLTVKIVVEDVEDCSDPEAIARIDEFVCSPIETSKLDLPLRKPLNQFRYIYLLQSSHQSECCYPAISKTSMSLTSNHIRNTSFVGLWCNNSLCYSLQHIFRQLQWFNDQSNNIRGSQVAFSMFVHHKSITFFEFTKQPVKRLSVQNVISWLSKFQNC